MTETEYNVNRWTVRYGYENSPKAIIDKAKKIIVAMSTSIFANTTPLNSDFSKERSKIS